MTSNNNINEIEQYLTSLKSNALKINLKDGLSSQFSSRTGGIFYDVPGKTWPKGSNGPLRPLIQIAINELPYIPKKIENLVGLCIYIDMDYVEYGSVPQEGADVVIREIPKDTEIVSLKNPIDSKFEEHDIEWIEFLDYPGRDDFLEWLDKQGVLYDDQDKNFCELLETYSNYGFTKINGWPTTIQSPSCGVNENDEFAIQFSLDIELPFGDSTVFTLSWANRINDWFTEWETC